MPVQRRVEFKIVRLVHQSLTSLAPTYLTTDIHLVSEYGRRPLRSSTDRTLTVPRNPEQIWWQKLCCCRASFVEQFADKSAADL